MMEFSTFFYCRGQSFSGRKISWNHNWR